MEESEEDGEDNEVFLEQLMMRTGQAVPRQELEEQYTVLEELGSGTYGRVVLTEPRDGGEELLGGGVPALVHPMAASSLTSLRSADPLPASQAHRWSSS